jgi:hypothetical protein
MLLEIISSNCKIAAPTITKKEAVTIRNVSVFMMDTK